MRATLLIAPLSDSKHKLLIEFSLSDCDFEGLWNCDSAESEAERKNINGDVEQLKKKKTMTKKNFLCLASSLVKSCFLQLQRGN